MIVSIYWLFKAEEKVCSEMNKGNSVVSVIWRHFKVFAETSSLLSLSWSTAVLRILENFRWLWYLFMVSVTLQAILLLLYLYYMTKLDVCMEIFLQRSLIRDRH